MKRRATEADSGEQPGKGREQWLEKASLAPGWHSGLPEPVSVSRPGDGGEDGCTDPPGPSAARLPTHPLLPPPLRRDHPSLLKGVPVCPPGTCTLVPFGSAPQHAATGLFAYCPQSTPRLSLPLLGSPAPSPSPPRPPGRWPRPDTFFSPDPQAPTHTVLRERFPTVS